MDELDIIEACLMKKSLQTYTLKRREKYYLWRYGIFLKHKLTCRLCNIVFSEDQLEAHHVLPRRLFPHLEFDINNGVPLCLKCHKKTRMKELLFVNLLTPYLEKQRQILDSIDKKKIQELIQKHYKRVFTLMKISRSKLSP